MVALPAPTNDARFEEKVTTFVSLEVHDVEEVTSEPLKFAEKLAVVPLVNVGPAGCEVMLNPLPPLTLPVADPLTPPTVALMVTFVELPTPFTTPALTVAQGVELAQFAELVTSLLPLLKLAVA
jgi:hypothetical protein